MSTLNYIHPKAKVGNNVQIEQFVTVQDNVEIGDGSWIGPNVTLFSGTRIGKNCRVFPGAVIGAIPQDLKFDGEDSIVEIGDNVTIREFCTLNRGTKANYKTKISDNCLLMAYVHVAHDCVIGHNCILANGVNLAGHIEIGDYAIISALSAAHQFVKIGKHSMITGGSLIRKDVPPFVKAAREPLSYAGVNSIGLRRRGFSSERINNIMEIYRILYVKGHAISKAVNLIEQEIPNSEDKEYILNFVNKAERGLMRGYQ
ncbi:acyl-ACP--UDP-N-acetylglucosamine O-acyltransferase [Portibacter marinus]|uniref:acyl-ACP--UDP-N-acetylglucosamine O-acyltransferase n=1 Tax=Portibacter marinus TaxID=2898660 RepID=UPI001F1A2C01|nr:acyl-ACP--UDP-N-acetylglucosamine O-acyltransferase [Portibacter marinus]